MNFDINKLDAEYTAEGLLDAGMNKFISQLILQFKSKRDNILKIQKEYNLSIDEATESYDAILEEHIRKYQTFWNIKLDKNNNVKCIELDSDKYLSFLNSNFNIFRINQGGKKEYIKIDDNVVDIISISDIKTMLQDWMNDLPSRFDLISKSELKNFIFKGAKAYFNDDLFDFLPLITSEFYWRKDTATHSFHYFKNTCVVVDAQGIKKFPYSELQGCIWKSQIKDIDFIDTTKESDFKRFVEIICKDSNSRFKDTMTCIGYMLHTFKFQNKTYSICLNDEFRTDENGNGIVEGGTGKGLLFKGLEQLRNVVKIDGKNFKFDKSFMFSRVGLDTEILLFDDIDRKFDFEKLFSVITEGITTEKKGIDEMYISYEDMAKIGLTTNYVIQGKGNSYTRRKIDIEVANYFNDDRSPVDEFGCMFFQDWGSEEYSSFINFMLDCQIEYFQRGVQRPIASTMEIHQVESSLPKGLFGNLEKGGVIVFGKEYTARDMADIVKDNSFITAPTSQRSKANLLKYAEYKGWYIQEGRNSSDRFVVFTQDKDNHQLEISETNVDEFWDKVASEV